MPDSIACRLYVLVVLIETTINLAIEGDLYLRIRDSQSDQQSSSVAVVALRRMPVYLAVFAMAQSVGFHLSTQRVSSFFFSVFQFVMAVDAVYARNTLQFIFLT